MKNKLCIGGTLLMLAAMAALGAENMNPEPGVCCDQGDLYRANEVSVDVFATASIGEYTINHLSGDRIKHDARLGGGAGVNYYFTRNIGIGADAYLENTHGSFIDSASANMLFRFPLGQSGLAPYGFGGGGHQFGLSEKWFGQVGAGLEYRFTPTVGIFTDARWVLPEHGPDAGVGRLGMRFAF